MTPPAGQAVGVPGKGNVVVRRDQDKLTIVSGSTEGFLEAPAAAEVCIHALESPGCTSATAAIPSRCPLKIAHIAR